MAQSALEFIKLNLRIDHDAFDSMLNLLLEASKEYMSNIGINIEESESGLKLLAHFHFIQSNFKNGQMSESKEYVFSPMYHNLIEQLRNQSE